MRRIVSKLEVSKKTSRRILLFAAIVLVAAPRFWAAVADQGLFWPDEFFQSLEQAHRFAFGYGIVPWEFVRGARSWVYPGALGLLWKALAEVGLDDARVLVVAAKLVTCGLGVWGAMCGFRMAHRVSRRFEAGILALVGMGLFPALVLFGSKCFTESVSWPFVLAAALLCERSMSGARYGRLLAGGLLGLAVFIRYQSGIFLLGYGLVLMAQRRWRGVLAFGLGAAIAGTIGCAVDWIAWGNPIHSFAAYVGFHAENGAAPWGASGSDYYFLYTWRSAGVAFLPFIAGALVSARWRPAQALVIISYIAIHLAVPHKEYRYITPVIPLLVVEGSVGLARLAAGLPRASRGWIARALIAGVVLGFVVRSADMTFDDLGHGDGLAAGLASGGDSPWHAAEGINRLLWRAGREPDVCGVLIKDIPWSSTGAYAYLHRDVPLLFRATPESYASANYLIARREFVRPWEYEEGPESRGFMLFHRPGGCAAPPTGYTRIVPP